LQTLLQKVPPIDRSLLVLKTELVKLFNTMIRLEESLARIEGCDETKTQFWLGLKMRTRL